MFTEQCGHPGHLDLLYVDMAKEYICNRRLRARESVWLPALSPVHHIP